MSTWSLTKEGSWSRPLGHQEAGFHYDGQFEGTADIIHHLAIDVLESDANSLMDFAHISGTWIRFKNRFPILAAKIVENEASPLNLDFVVSEDRLGTNGPDEVVLHEASSSDITLEELIDRLLRGPRVLSAERGARLDILPSTRVHSERRRFHLIFTYAHCICDGTSAVGSFKVYLDLLTTSQPQISTLSLAERLELIPPVDQLNVPPKWSAAKRRWKLAIANTLMQMREERVVGGHTFPSIANSQVLQPAKSEAYQVILDEKTSSLIFQCCRKQGFTVGNTLNVLSQTSLSKALHKRFRRGEMTSEEWEHRIRQPMHFGGPVNPRLRYDPEWVLKGGPAELFIAIAYTHYSLPSMPRCLDASKADPTWNDLLSKQRFYRRCRTVKPQLERVMNHPSFLQIAALRDRQACAKKLDTLGLYKGTVRAETNFATRGFGTLSNKRGMTTNGGSTFGIQDAILLKEYPQGETGSSPKVVVDELTMYLRSRPRELYLVTSTFRGRLKFGCWWDGNAWDNVLVKEWVDGVADAARFYLGGGGGDL